MARQRQAASTACCAQNCGSTTAATQSSQSVAASADGRCAPEVGKQPSKSSCRSYRRAVSGQAGAPNWLEGHARELLPKPRRTFHEDPQGAAGRFHLMRGQKRRVGDGMQVRPNDASNRRQISASASTPLRTACAQSRSPGTSSSTSVLLPLCHDRDPHKHRHHAQPVDKRGRDCARKSPHAMRVRHSCRGWPIRVPVAARTSWSSPDAASGV